MSTRHEFLAPIRAAERPEVPEPELPPLRPERGAALVERFAAAAEASGAHVHRGAPPDLAGDVGVSRALYGLADTGSVVLAASPDEPRSRSLLPWTHMALLRVDDIVSGLAELFAELGPGLPSALAIVTGPSRSADIEQRLAVGVHGPGEVHIVLET